MSKEIQCKCCKDYWWETDIHSKSGLCPNCYDYFANLEAKLAESEDRIEKARRQAYSSRQIDNTLKIRRLADEITAKDKAIVKLKQQLKDTEESYNNTMRYLNKTRSELLNLPKKIVEEIRTYCNLKEFNPEFVDKEHQECVVSYTELIDFLDTILKKYGGGR